MKDYGPGYALGVAVIVAIMYAEGGVLQIIASLIILAVLITPVNGESIIVGLLKFIEQQAKYQPEFPFGG